MKKFIPLLLVIFLTACLPSGVQVPQSPLLSVLEKKSGLISYIGTDGNIYIVDQSGSKPTQLTKDSTIAEKNPNSIIVYQNPTWSLDGSQLAFVRLEQDASQQVSSKVFVANMDDDTVKSIYSSNTEHPFYLSWSPNNANISALNSSTANQNIVLKNIPASGSDAQVLDIGSPFYYFSWAPDGKTMIAHKGLEDNTSRLSFLNVDTSVTESMMEEEPASFFAPAWSPDGKYILLTKGTGKDQQIVLADSSGTEIKTISSFDVNTAFAWSFDSKQFAYILGTQKMDSGTIGALHVYDIETDKDVSITDNVVGFFWSPNGKKLAYFVPFLASPNTDSSGSSSSSSSSADTSTLLFQLNMLDLGSGESKELFTFQPTQQFVSIIPYFDQYHQSATIWAPDSNNLALSYIGQDGNPGIAIVAPSGQMEPRFIANGFLAFWSWK